MSDKKSFVTITVQIEPEGLKRAVEEGRLMEFVTTLSSLAAAHIQTQVVNQIAKAGAGIGKAGDSVSFPVNFDIHIGYGWGPIIPGPIPRVNPHLPWLESETISVQQTE
jgi:hypothetical protein